MRTASVDYAETREIQLIVESPKFFADVAQQYLKNHWLLHGPPMLLSDDIPKIAQAVVRIKRTVTMTEHSEGQRQTTRISYKDSIGNFEEERK